MSIWKEKTDTTGWDELYPSADPEVTKALQLEAKRLGDAERERDETSVRDFLAEIKAKALLEAAAWQSTACGGELERVTQCPDEVRDVCPRREHRMCPRQRVKDLAVEDEARNQSKRRGLLASGVPLEVIAAVYDVEPADTEALRKLRAALAEQPTPRIVILQGGVGCGKTCAATWWLARHGGAFVSAGELGQLSPYDDRGRALLMTPHLVLDDLGVEYLDPKGFLKSVLDGLITARYAAGRPTVITTNLIPWAKEGQAPQFFDRYGERIADRVRESGRFIAVGGTSLRRK